MDRPWEGARFPKKGSKHNSAQRTGGLGGRAAVLSRWLASSQWACSMACSRSSSSARCSCSRCLPLCSSRARACSRASLKARRERPCWPFTKAGTRRIGRARREYGTREIVKGAGASAGEARATEEVALHHSLWDCGLTGRPGAGT